MKKKLLLIAVSLVMTVSLAAQLGIKAGMNFAKLSGASSLVGSETTLNNFQFGVFTHKDIIPLLKIRVGLDYSPKGSKWESGSSYSQVTYNYLELPVLARVKLGPVYGLGGFYGAYAMNGKRKSSLAGIEIEDDLDFDATSRWDYGMKFGLGFQLGLGPIHAFAEADYSFGFQNINTSSIGNDIKNSVIGVSVGVLLGGK